MSKLIIIPCDLKILVARAAHLMHYYTRSGGNSGVIGTV